MSGILKTEWTIRPTTPPQPWLACSNCGGAKPFRCSDRLRLNANGKKLDAWLIYRGSACDKTWNRPLFERRNIREIDAADLAAFQTNDPEWIRTRAFDPSALRRHTVRVDEFADVAIEKVLMSQADEWGQLEIALHIPLPISKRLDRLISTELGFSRSRVQALERDRRLKVEPPCKDALRRPASNGIRLRLELSDAPDRQAIGDRASGSCKP